MRKIILIFFCLVLLYGQALAEPGLKIITSLDKTTDPLPFGKTATLTLELSWESKWPFEPPSASSLKLPEFTLLDAYSTEVATVDTSSKQLSYHLVFTMLEPGTFTIPALEFSTPNGVAKSDKLSIQFSGSKPLASDKPGELRAAKKAIELSTRDFWIWLIKALALALLILTCLAFLGSKASGLVKWLSPQSRALRQLKKLDRKLSNGSLSAEAGILELIEVIRIYLRRAYGLVTREATSKEIVHQLVMNNRCKNIKPVVDLVLQEGDKTKFAAASATAEQAKDLLQQLVTALAHEKKLPKKVGDTDD